MKREKQTRDVFLRQILVAVDAEGLADHAIHAGLELARRFGAKIELLHAVSSPAVDWQISDDAGAAASVLTEARRAMGAHVSKVLAEAQWKNGTAVDLIRILPGKPAQVVLDRARELDADLVVLGAHKRRGIVDFGSTVRAVLSKAPKGVWIQPHAFESIRRILVPVDLSEDSLRALASACALAKVLDARVRAIHCFQGASYVVSAWPEYPDFGSAYAIEEVRAASKAGFEKALKAFDWQGVPHQTDFLEGDPAERILDLSRSVDLVAMGTHGRTGLSSVLLGNVAYSVLKRSEKPVLALRHPERTFLT